MRLHQVRASITALFALVLSACGALPTTPIPNATSLPSSATAVAYTPTPKPIATWIPTATSTATVTATPTVDPLPTEMGLDPEQWMTWPVLPTVTQRVREIYALGQTLGNDPHGFSILGDCQSTPDTFLGLYVVDESQYLTLPEELRETVTYFEESFVRESPTIKPGTTSGALLWAEWHENKFTCANDEKPLDCELRINNPSFALITIGTHWEARNDMYMRKILDALLARGVVPILSTKADNREGNNRLNLETAQLAAEYNLPLWNFWPVTDDLPNRGLYTKKIDAHLGDIYLIDEALTRHRYSALQALDVVWRTASGQYGE
jgi:hypothetical protein